MARNFTRASSHYLEHAAAVVGSAPLTMACWGRYPTLAAGVGSTLMAISRDAGNVRDAFVLDILEGGTDTVRALAGAGGVNANGTINFAVAADTWFHAGAVFASTTSRTAYLNGTAGSANTTSIAPSSLNRTAFGRIPNFQSAAINYWNGDLAEAGVWSVALSAADMAMLAAGVSPLLVRPDALVAYTPLLGQYSPETSPRGGYDFTVTGASASSSHPRVYRPSRRGRVSLDLTAGGGPVTADLSATLAGPTLSSALAVLVDASAAPTLAAPSLSSALAVTASAAASPTLGGPSLSSACAAGIDAACSAAAGGPSCSAAAAVAVAAALSSTLAGPSLDATIGGGPVASLDAALAGPALSASAAALVSAALDVALAGPTLTAAIDTGAAPAGPRVYEIRAGSSRARALRASRGARYSIPASA